MIDIKWNTQLFRIWDGKKMWENKVSIVNGIDEMYCGDIDDLVFLQDTGRKDKNGVKIYKGDILKFGNTSNSVYDPLKTNNGMYGYMIGKVIYRDCNFCITDKSGLTNYWLGSKANIMIEVIGNIYKNPELWESLNA